MEKNVKADVLVVDDHSLVLEGICKVVDQMPEVAGLLATTSGKRALELISERMFDVYILDLSMPEVSGFDLIAAIREVNAKARIVVSTMHEEVWMVNRMINSGVNAIVLKSSASEELVAAVRAVLSGNIYTCPRFTSISKKMKANLDGIHDDDLPTRREREVLEAMAKGMNTHEIALFLKISENTVETFRKRLMSKFGAKNATDIVVKAITRGWIELDKST